MARLGIQAEPRQLSKARHAVEKPPTMIGYIRK
jgi:hypothetical protein